MLNALATCLLALLAAGSVPEDLREAARQVFADGDYQTDLPGVETLESSGIAGGDPRSVRRGTPPESGDRVSVPGAGPIARLLGAVVGNLFLPLLLIVIMILAVCWLARVLGERARRKTLRKIPLEEAAASAASRGPLPDPDGLAREGRFTEAIHALLLRAQVAFAAYAMRTFPPSLTSREILRAAELPGAGGDLSSLVRAVEISLFGGRRTGRPEYERCLGHYETVLRACGGGGA